MTRHSSWSLLVSVRTFSRVAVADRWMRNLRSPQVHLPPFSARRRSPRRATGLRVASALAVMALTLVAASAQACSGSACYQSVGAFGKDPASGHGVFRFPQAIAFSPGGTFVFVADQYSAVVQKFDYAGAYQGWSIGGYADRGQFGRFGVIGGLATDRNGHLYVLDSENDRVQVFRSDTGAWLAAFGSSGSSPGLFNLGANTGAGGIAVYQEPSTASPNPNPPLVYVADQDNHRIQKFTLSQTSARDSGSGPALPAGQRGSTDAGSDQYNVIAAPVPDSSWGSLGACNDSGQPACASSATFNLALNHPQGIAVDPAADALGRHDVYVADDDNHRIVEYDPGGGYLNQVGTMGGGACQFRFPYDVGVDGNTVPQAIANTCGQTVTGSPAPNNLDVADNNNHRVVQFNAATLAFQRAWGAFGPQPGSFEFPRSLAALSDNPQGGVYVTDTANNRIEGWFQTAGGPPTYTWGTSGRGPGYVTRPAGVALDGAGNLYIADTLDSRIEKLDAAGGYVGQYAYVSPNSGFATPSSGQGAFSEPAGVAYDPSRNEIWVADTSNNRVEELTTTPSTINTTNGTTNSFVKAYGGFSKPKGIAVDRNGAVYVADTGNNRIQKLSGGSWSTLTGTTLSAPRGVAVDDQTGDIYVADSGNNRILRFAGGTWSTITGTFSNPGGLFVDAARRLYVADTGADKVQRLDLTNTATGWDEWGTDDTALGGVIRPASLAGDPAGHVVVADTYNNRVQQFTLTVPPTPTAPDFTLSASPPSLTIARGGAGSSSTITIGPSGGFGDPVTLATSGRPTGVSLSPASPVTVAPDASGAYPPTALTFSATNTAKPGSYTITITGTAGAATHSTRLTLQVKRK
jgi:DNA-binding beta-propeller fold protein YncE